MIPIADSAPKLRPPVVVPLLIVLNVVLYALQLGLEPAQAAWLFDRFGVEPVDFFAKWRAVSDDPGLLRRGSLDFVLVGVTPLVTYQFLHAGPLHLLGNVLFLWVFGDNVEGRVGRKRFLLFYLACGVLAALAHCYMEPEGRAPVVGASGAISGVLGAYLLMFPRSRVTLLVPIVIVFAVVQLPAWFVLSAWFALQIPDVQGVLGRLDIQGVAWWAHAGGFVAGMAIGGGMVVGRLPADRRSPRKKSRVERRTPRVSPK